MSKAKDSTSVYRYRMADCCLFRLLFVSAAVAARIILTVTYLTCMLNSSSSDRNYVTFCSNNLITTALRFIVLEFFRAKRTDAVEAEAVHDNTSTYRSRSTITIDVPPLRPHLPPPSSPQ